MSSINKHIVLDIPVKEALYISKITGGTTKIQIKEFRVIFPIHIKKSEHGDFYPTSFRISVISDIGHEYRLEELEFISPDQEKSESFAKIENMLEKMQEKKQEFKKAVQSGKYAELIKNKKEEEKDK